MATRKPTPKITSVILTLETFRGHDIYVFGEFFAAFSADRKWCFDREGFSQTGFEGQHVETVEYTVNAELMNYARGLLSDWEIEYRSRADDPQWFLSCFRPMIIGAVKFGYPKPSTENDRIVWPVHARSKLG